MKLDHIVVAADESDAGREAVRAAVDLAGKASARVTVMRTVPIPAVPVFKDVRGGGEVQIADLEAVEADRLRTWLRADVLSPAELAAVEPAITYGVPGVEICRFAEVREADLLVLGRKPRSQMTRLLLGDTADAVARRSRIPCLFVPPGHRPVRQVLAALDGTARGLGVLVAACDFASGIGAALRAVTVERAPVGEPVELANALPVARSAQLESQVRAITASPLEVRRGPIVDEVLAAVDDSDADALVIGYHRGGPPGVLEAGSTARRLAHTAHCAVLTIPL